MPEQVLRHAGVLVTGCLLLALAGLSAAAEPHWAYRPVLRPPVPLLPGKSAASNPIDAFVLEKLGTEGLGYASAADRRTLLRRLSMDLTGLPATWEEVQGFVRDQHPGAYDRAVERLLLSPHYGERMAQYWLDWVRYAYTVGFHGDQPLKMWPYSDYVIESFNRNRPFDQFTIDQIAGDIEASPAPEQLVATAYNRLNRMTAEAGANDAEYLVIYAADRVSTTAAVWLGSTLACAQCHDHKHDPFSQQDFYSFAAFFADIDEQGFYADGIQWGPELKLTDPKTAAARAELQKAIDAADAAVKDRRQAIKTNLPAATAQFLQRLAGRESLWQPLRPLKVETEGDHTVTFLRDDSVRLGGARGISDVYSVWLPRIRDRIVALRVDFLPRDGFRRWGAAAEGWDFTVTELELARVRDEMEVPVTLGKAAATLVSGGQGSPQHAIDGLPGTGWRVDPLVNKDGRSATFHLMQPLLPAADTRLLLRLRLKAGEQQQLPQHFRVSFSSWDNAGLEKSGLSADFQDLLKRFPKDCSPFERQIVEGHLLRLDMEYQELRRTRLALDRAAAQLDAAEPAVLITRSRTPRPTRILSRGNWQDDAGPVVDPAVPRALGGLEPTDRRASRLDLARWLVDRQQPLTARVMMNRLWQALFGRGLVTTPDDFGTSGAPPSHPELLDWLAAEFMESGWNWQHMVRLMVTSQAYQQQSSAPDEVVRRDPENRLWSRQMSFRIDAEQIRDTALAVSGLLNKDIGGPGVRPYQPDGYYASLSFPVRTYDASTGADQYRRGLYTHWQRTFLHPTLKVFDAPSREECVITRARSNTPLQALTLLNDPSFVEAARALALRLLQKHPATDEERIHLAFQMVLQRPPATEELALLRTLVTEERQEQEAARSTNSPFLHIGQLPLPPGTVRSELIVWTQAARVLLNLHETIMRY